MFKFISNPEVCEMFGYSQSTLNRQEKLGLMPPSINISSQRKVKIKSEVKEIQKARILGKDDETVKELVKHLVEKRAELATAELSQ